VIVVRVELWSAVTHEKTELARMHISNVGGTDRRRNYEGATFRGRSEKELARLTMQKTGRLVGFPSLDLHIWNLVTRMLLSMGYK